MPPGYCEGAHLTHPMHKLTHAHDTTHARTDLGVVVDTSAFVAPTTFTEAVIKVSTHAPTTAPTVTPLPCQTKTDRLNNQNANVDHETT